MLTPKDDQQLALREALDDLEACVETPFVPGELERWMGAVDDTWQRVRPLLSWLISTCHPELYIEIQNEDEGLIRRVEQMRQEDRVIAGLADDFGQRIPHVQSAIIGVEPDEAKLKPVLTAFISEALNLIIRIRKQEQAVRTWLLEAFTRDRGTVD